MYVIQTDPSGRRERFWLDSDLRAPVYVALADTDAEKVELTMRSGVKWTYERTA